MAPAVNVEQRGGAPDPLQATGLVDEPTAKLSDDFADAVKLLGTSRFGAALPEEQQRRLYGLHTRATRGAAPDEPPEGMHADQWAAWREAGRCQTAEAAMEEYMGAVELASLEAEDEANDRGAAPQGVDDLPPGIREQLERAGLIDADAPELDEVVDIFEAARLGGAAVETYLQVGGGLWPATVMALRDADGLSALHHAVDAGCSSSVVALLAAKAFVDLACTAGQTPLHYAAMLDAPDLAKLLLEAGASTGVKDSDGATPADLAESAALKQLLAGGGEEAK